MARFSIKRLNGTALALACLSTLASHVAYGMDDINEKKRKLVKVLPNVSNKKREMPPFKGVTEPEIIPLHIQEKLRDREICDYMDQAEKYEDTSFTLIQTPKKHCSTLLDVIGLTEESLIITTYQLNITRKFHPRLFRALEKASQRGVKIKLYYNHLPENEYQDYILGDFGNISNLECNKIGSHVKFVVSDKKVAAIGSFNWLSDYREEIEDDFGEGYQNSTNVSLLIQGSLVKHLKEKYYKIISSYYIMSLFYEKVNQFQNKFNKEKDKNQFLPVGYYASVMLLRTPQDHYYYLQKLFDEVKSTLEIYSPFIGKSRKYQAEILPQYKLSAFLETGKKLVIHYLDDNKNRQFMNKCYGPIAQKYQNFKLIPTNDMHEKLLIIDEKSVDNKIVIGSFNWLSSAISLTLEENLEEFREDASDLFFEKINNANMCDFSLVLSGKEAEIKISELRHEKHIFSPEKPLLKQSKKAAPTSPPLKTQIKKIVPQNRQPEISVHKNAPVILPSKKEKIITESKEGKKSFSPKINPPIPVTNAISLSKKIDKPTPHKDPLLPQPKTNVLFKSSANNTNKPAVPHTKTHLQVVKESLPLKKFERPTLKKTTFIPQPKKKALKTPTKKINERSKGYINLEKSLQNQPKITQFFNKNDK